MHINVLCHDGAGMEPRNSDLSFSSAFEIFFALRKDLSYVNEKSTGT